MPVAAAVVALRRLLSVVEAQAVLGMAGLEQARLLAVPD
jgi:hypothetical protein